MTTMKPRSRKVLENRYKEVSNDYRGKDSSLLNEAIEKEFSELEIDILFS